MFASRKHGRAMTQERGADAARVVPFISDSQRNAIDGFSAKWALHANQWIREALRPPSCRRVGAVLWPDTRCDSVPVASDVQRTTCPCSEVRAMTRPGISLKRLVQAVTLTAILVTAFGVHHRWIVKTAAQPVWVAEALGQTDVESRDLTEAMIASYRFDNFVMRGKWVLFPGTFLAIWALFQVGNRSFVRWRVRTLIGMVCIVALSLTALRLWVRSIHYEKRAKEYAAAESRYGGALRLEEAILDLSRSNLEIPTASEYALLEHPNEVLRLREHRIRLASTAGVDAARIKNAEDAEASYLRDNTEEALKAKIREEHAARRKKIEDREREIARDRAKLEHANAMRQKYEWAMRHPWVMVVEGAKLPRAGANSSGGCPPTTSGP